MRQAGYGIADEGASFLQAKVPPDRGSLAGVEINPTIVEIEMSIGKLFHITL